MFTMKPRALTFLLAVFAAVPLTAGAEAHHPELSAADLAYSSGNYEAAAALYRRDAELGVVAAQVTLALLYTDGQGVAQDLAQAAHWFGRAAAQGNAEAQQNLGVLYRDGKGVKQSGVEAAKWFHIAGAKADAAGVEKSMTPEQIAEAKKLAENWSAEFKKTHGR